MGCVYNIRGTNGAGKTTIARAFLPPNLKGDAFGGPVDLVWYDAPTKKDPSRRLRTEGYRSEGLVNVGVVGRYLTACGGMDAIGSFALQQASITDMLERLRCGTVVAEGVLASTVFGSWAEYDRELEARGHRFAWVYLHTPLEVCLQRIALRQQASAGGERPIKQDLVENKVRAIRATRQKALEAGRLVYDLPYDPIWGGREVEALRAIMTGEGEMYLGKR